ncbi:DUF1761 domain-containing protein [Candidatus Parcubacteria bacterium]|nr:DUF1761 domain-containing protein [Candidatus Parcubacteria bacterium]
MDTVINFWAVLSAAIATFVIGALWYSPALFAKPWMKAVGKRPEELGNPTASMLGMFIASLITAYILAHFIQYANATTAHLGMQAGFWAWLGFVATSTLAVYLFEGRPKKLWLMFNGYQLISFLVMGAILAVWR